MMKRCLILMGLCACTALARNKPNIVFYIADDHSQLDSEVYGATVLRTPNMLKLAKATEPGKPK